MANVVKLTPRPAKATPAPRTTIARAAVASDKPPKVYEVRADKPLGLLLRVHAYRACVCSTSRPAAASGCRSARPGRSRWSRRRTGQRRSCSTPRPRPRPSADGITLREYITDHYSAHALARQKNGAEPGPPASRRMDAAAVKRMPTSPGRHRRLRDKRILAGGRQRPSIATWPRCLASSPLGSEQRAPCTRSPSYAAAQGGRR